MERSFFAAAPPEEPQPLGEATRVDDPPAPAPQRPRPEIFAWLRPSIAGAGRAATLALGAAVGLAQRAWRGTTFAFRAAGRLTQRAGRSVALIVGAAGVKARHAARAGAAGLVAALSSWRVDRRRLVLAVAGVIMAAGLTAGNVVLWKRALTNGATARSERPVSGPTVAEAAPIDAPASEAAPRPNAQSSANVRASRADASNRRPHAHRKHVPASSSSQRPVMTAFMDRETYWAREPRSAPVRSSKSFFSR